MNVPHADSFDPNDDEQVRSLAARARLDSNDLVVISPPTHTITVVENVVPAIYPDLIAAIRNNAGDHALIIVHALEPIVRINITKETPL